LTDSTDLNGLEYAQKVNLAFYIAKQRESSPIVAKIKALLLEIGKIVQLQLHTYFEQKLG
jgi:hypothetical protein